jgi:iron complex transport system permease protein
MKNPFGKKQAEHSSFPPTLDPSAPMSAVGLAKADRTPDPFSFPASISLKKVLLVTGIMLVLLLLTILLALFIGSAGSSWDKLWGLLNRTLPPEDPFGIILLKIRLPRILLAGLVGFTLALGGVVFQALLRNPLADPFILGLSSGSALGAVLGIFFGFSFHLGIPLMAFGGALITILIVTSLGARSMGTESATILLTGVIINAFFTAIIMFFITSTTDSRLHTMLFWLYGDLSQSYFSPLAVLTPVICIVSLVLFGFSRDLNLLTSGEETALQLGVEVTRTKFICLIAVSLLISLVISFSGLIGFVGLIVPHLGRMAFGSDHRVLMPVSALGGAIFLIIADTLARTVMAPTELPVGVITACLGAPFFVYLLKKKGSRWERS